MFMLPCVSQPPALKPTPHCDWPPRALCCGPNCTRITPAAWPWNSAAAVFCEVRISAEADAHDSLYSSSQHGKLEQRFLPHREMGGISHRSVGRNSITSEGSP